MGTLTTATTYVTAPVNFVLMRQLLETAEEVCPYYNGTQKATLEPGSGSLSVKWRRIENLSPATTALSELAGSATAFHLGRTAATPTITDITATVAKYGNFISYTEELDIVNVNSKAMALFDKLGHNAGLTLDILQRNAINTGATLIRYAGSVANDSAVGAAMTANDVRASVNQLDRNVARKFFAMSDGSTKIDSKTLRESYLGITHVDMENDIRDMTGFISVEQYASHTETYVGEFGAVNGVRWCSTDHAPISTGAGGASANGLRGADVGTHDVYVSFIYGQDAIGSVGLGTEHADQIYRAMKGNPSMVPSVVAINHPPGSAGAADPYNEVGTLSWKAWHAGKVLNNAWVVELRTAATDYSL